MEINQSNDLMEKILTQLQEGTMGLDEAKKRLRTFEQLGCATVDLHREKRQGFPEVIYGEGKTSDQIIEIAKTLMEENRRVLATRISEEKAREVQSEIPEMKYERLARLLVWIHQDEEVVLYEDYCAVVCAGTSDLPVAEEAAVTLEAMGSRVERIHDVGVSGIHRLLAHLDKIQNARVSVVVAGMEGALPSAVGGLVDHPVIAVPTSVGYGANFGGMSALLSMLNSCASGISVVNIDNGFGGAYNASLIHRMSKGQVKE